MRRLAASTPRALLLIALMSCTSDSTGPSQLRRTQFAIAPVLDRQLLAQVGVDRALVRFTRVADGTKALEAVVSFPATSDTLNLSVAVPLQGASEAFNLSILLLDDPAGDTVFRSGPTPITLTQGLTQSPPAIAPFLYSGQGANAAAVRFVTAPAQVFFGQTATFTAEAVDAANNVIPNTPIVWTTSDTAKATIPSGGVGNVVAGITRGPVTITASLLRTSATTAPPSVSASLLVQPVPNAIVAQAGAGQTGAVGATLPQPLKVHVTAADNLGVQGVAVAFAVTSGGGTVSAAQATTDANGDASITWTLGSALGAQTVTATAAGVTGVGVTFSATAIAGAASRLAFTTQPAASRPGFAIAPAVVVEVEDSFGHPVSSFTGPVTVALGTNPGSATLGGTVTVTAVAGVATFTNLVVSAGGDGYTLVASAAGLTAATSAPFVVSGTGPAAILAFVVQPSAATSGSVIAPPIQVAIRDANNATITTATNTITLAIAINPANGVIAGTVSAAAVNGVATFSDITITGAGSGYTLGASSQGLASATSAAFAVTAAAPTVLAFTTQPTASTAGAAIAPSVVVTARDAAGKTATTFTGAVTIALGTNPSNGALAGTTTVNAVAGVATFAGISIAKAASGYTLTGAATGFTAATSTSFTVAPAAPSQLAFTTQPVSAAAGAVLTPPVVVSALDAFGNVATAFTGNVVMAIGSNPGGSTLVGTTTVAAVSGAASFSNLSLTTRGVGYTLSATASGLTSAVSTAFDLTAVTLAWTNSAGGSWSNPANWSLGRVPQGADSVVITLPGTYAVTLDTTFTGAVLILGGASGTQTLSLASRTLTMSGSLTVNANGVLATTSAAIAGAGAVINGGTLNLKATTIGAGGITNSGTFIANAAVTVNGPFTTTAGSLLRLLADGTTGFSTFTSANSFTNNGTIELTTAGAGYSPTLAVGGTNTLTNAAGGTITSLVGAGGPRTIDAQLDNQGTLTLAQPLTLNHASASHINSGTIDASAADFTLTQSGTAPNFTNSGTVTIGTGRTWSITGGTLTQNAGTIGGAGTLSLSNLTANFATNVTNATTAFVASTVTFNGPGTLTNATGQTMSLKAVTIGATSALINQGTLITNAAVTVNGAFTTAAGSILRLLADGTTGFSTFTSANSFTNTGTIELTTAGAGYSPTLAVGGTNTLTNAAGGTITSLVGAGGPRTIDAQLNNQGTLTLAQPLTLNHASASHTNSGTIDASTGDLTVSQSGTAPTFTNTGTVTVGAGHTLAVTNGTFTQSGTLNGSGGVTLTNATTTFSSPVTVAALNVSGGTVAFAANQSTGSLVTSLVNTVVNGPGSLTNVAGQTLSIQNVTFNTALANQGTLINDGTSTVGATNTFTTSAGSTLRLQATGSTGTSNLTLPPFTNAGAIELTTTTAAYSDVLNVSGSGILINAVGGTITSLVGALGPRTLGVQLDNRGLITINQPLTLIRASSAHSNSGTIDATAADFTVNQNGATSTFNNTGTLSIGAGRTLIVSTGGFTQNGTLNGGGTVTLASATSAFNNPFTLAALTVTNGPVSFANNVSTAGLALSLNGTTVSGPGTITNVAGQTMSIKDVTFNTSLANQGTLISDGTTTVGTTNTFTTSVGSTLRLQATGSTGTSNLTLPPFTNAGAIELTTIVAAYSSRLNVSGSGTLTNASTGTITSLVGTLGTRTISAELVNQGLVTVNQALVLNRAASVHSNNGTIDATNADLTIINSGVPATFDNSGGVITVGAGHTLSFSGAGLTSGTLNGGGTLSLNGAGTTFSNTFTLPALIATGGFLGFTNGQATAGISMTLASTTITGPFFTNSVGQTLNVRAVTFNTALTNQGLLITDGATTVTGSGSSFSNAAGSTLLINATGATGNSTFSVPSFTNFGSINFTTTTATYTDVLTVGGGTGTLTNDAGAFMKDLTGTGGSRTINGTLDNFGTIDVQPGPSSGGTLQVNGAFNHRGTGILNLELAGPAPSTGYSRISVSGATFLFQGILNYALIGGFTPTSGSTFDILTSSTSVGGTFAIRTQPPGWANATYSATLVRLTAP